VKWLTRVRQLTGGGGELTISDDGAQNGEPRSGHSEFRCKTCDGIVLLPACTEPTQKTGWAAHHGQ
jgi:hypothetical protein